MKTLEKTFDIVDCLESSSVAKLGTIAERTGLPRSTVHHHLAILERRGFVVNEGGTYRLTLRFLDIGERTRRRTQLFQTARSEIDELSQSIDRPVTVFVLEHGQAVVLYTYGGDSGLPITLHAGQHLPLHATAAGKAMLSTNEAETYEELMDGINLRAYTEHTITDVEALDTAVGWAADQGYSIAKEELWNRRCSIAVPFSSGQDSLVAAVEVALTPNEIQEADHDELAAKIDRTVSVIDIKSDYS